MSETDHLGMLIIAAANERFLEYMRERHYRTEEAALADLRVPSTATALICAVARWRIAQRDCVLQQGKDGG